MPQREALGPIQIDRGKGLGNTPEIPVLSTFLPRCGVHVPGKLPHIVLQIRAGTLYFPCDPPYDLDMKLWKFMSPEAIEAELGIDVLSSERPTIPAPKVEVSEADRRMASALDILSGPSPRPIKW